MSHFTTIQSQIRDLEALGKPGARTRKPDFWRQSARQSSHQQLGGSEG